MRNILKNKIISDEKGDNLVTNGRNTLHERNF